MMNGLDVLSQLDRVLHWYFPMINSPRVYPAAARLTAYCDSEDWALTIEECIYRPWAMGNARFTTLVYQYGSCLEREPTRDDKPVYIYAIEEEASAPIFANRVGKTLLPSASTALLVIRGRKAQVALKPEEFERKGIELRHPPEIDGPDLLRLLAQEYRDLVLASDAERQRKMRKSLPRLLQLDEWNHPVTTSSRRPSQSECFQMLATAMASCDASLYRPTEPPNTDWRNWPEAGMM